MNQPSNVLRAAVRAALALSASAVASNAIGQVEEITVTGSVLQSNQVNSMQPPLAIIDVPQSVSITTSEDIRDRGFRELGDIVRYTPGVNQSQGEGHRDSVVFRGVRSTADFYRDGLRDDVQYYRSLYNVEQVEILRGPNALLFGRGGTGGVINRVTKEAIVGQQLGSFDIGADSFGAFDFAGDVNIQTGANSALRINVHSDSLENHRDFFEGDRVGFNPTFKMELSDQTELVLSYEHANHERFIDRGIPTGADGKPVKSLDGITFGGEDENIQTLKADIFKGTLRHEFSDSTKGQITVQVDEFEKMYQNLYASGYDGAANTVTLDGYRDPTERENTFIDANLVNEFDTGSMSHTLSIGGQIVDTDNSNYRYDSYWTTTGKDKETFNIADPLNIGVNSAGDPTRVDFYTKMNRSTTSDIEVTSIYVQDQIDISDNLIVMLGGRIDNFDITVDDIKTGLSQSREDDEFSPRGGLIYKPAENLSFYASYSESFLPRSGEQYKKLDVNAARLDPDVYENQEVGFKWDMLPGLSFSAAYFDSEQEQAVRDSIDGEQSEIVGLQVDGYELELKGQINDSFYIAAGYSKMDGETAKGGTPREIPEFTAFVWANYQISNNFGVGIGVTHQDDQNIKNDKDGLYLPDYTRWDAAGYYTLSDDLEIRVNIENWTDEIYFPYSHSTHQASVGKDINARLSITKRF